MDLNETYNGIKIISGEFSPHIKVITLMVSPSLEIKVSITPLNNDEISPVNTTEDFIKALLSHAVSEINNKLDIVSEYKRLTDFYIKNLATAQDVFQIYSDALKEIYTEYNRPTMSHEHDYLKMKTMGEIASKALTSKTK